MHGKRCAQIGAFRIGVGLEAGMPCKIKGLPHQGTARGAGQDLTHVQRLLAALPGRGVLPTHLDPSQVGGGFGWFVASEHGVDHLAVEVQDLAVERGKVGLQGPRWGCVAHGIHLD